MHYLIKTFLIFILLCVSHSGHSKDYIVEMIFFANIKGNAGPVHISNQAVIPDLDGALTLEQASEIGFISLDSEIFQLSNKAHALNKSGNYSVLKHIAWLQPGLAKEDAIAIRIHAGKNYKDEFKERSYAQIGFSDTQLPINHPVNELDGTVKIVLGRFLHLYTDLVYRKTFNISSSDALGRSRVLADFPVKSHRKMRSKTLHYVDHPYLGILIEIRSVE